MTNIHSNRPPYELAAWLMALLAYPGVTDSDTRTRTYNRLCSYMLMNPGPKYERSIDIADVNPIHLNPRKREIILGSRFHNRINARDLSALVARPLIHKAMANSLSLPAKAPSFTTLVGSLGDSYHEVDIANFRKRQWLQTLHILHLALAYHDARKEFDLDDKETGYTKLFFDPDVIGYLVWSANQYAPWVVKIWERQIIFDEFCVVTAIPQTDPFFRGSI